MYAVLLVLLMAIGCRRETSAEIHADPKTSAVPAPSPTHEPEPPPTRLRGPIDGRFVLEGTAISGTPLMATFVVTNTGTVPLVFSMGGDYRGTPWWHLRYGLVVKKDGKVLCDTIEHPPMMFGGLGTNVTVAPKDTHRDHILLSGVCESLNLPGRYRVLLQRRLMLGMTMDAGVGKVPSSCDESESMSDPIPRDAGLPLACVKALEASPFVASELDLEVLPYDPVKVTAAIEAFATAPHREWPMDWFCSAVHCACPKPPSYGHEDPVWIHSVAATVPTSPQPTFPHRCGAK